MLLSSVASCRYPLWVVGRTIGSYPAHPGPVKRCPSNAELFGDLRCANPSGLEQHDLSPMIAVTPGADFEAMSDVRQLLLNVSKEARRRERANERLFGRLGYDTRCS